MPAMKAGTCTGSPLTYGAPLLQNKLNSGAKSLNTHLRKCIGYLPQNTADPRIIRFKFEHRLP